MILISSFLFCLSVLLGNLVPKAVKIGTGVAAILCCLGFLVFDTNIPQDTETLPSEVYAVLDNNTLVYKNRVVKYEAVEDSSIADTTAVVVTEKVNPVKVVTGWPFVSQHKTSIEVRVPEDI